MTTIAVSTGTTFQTIIGWGCGSQSNYTPDIGTNPAVNPDFANYINTAVDTAVNGIGYNIMNFPIRGGLENPTPWFQQWVDGTIVRTVFKSHQSTTINANTDSTHLLVSGVDINFEQIDAIIDHTIIPMRNALIARGESLFIIASYYSGIAAGDTGEAVDNYIHGNSGLYARYQLAVYLHMQSKYGFVPDAWQIENEPDFHNNAWYGAPFSTLGGVTMGNHIVAGAAKLLANGFTPRYLVPAMNTASLMNEFYDDIFAAVPAASTYAYFANYHRYDVPSTAVITAIGSHITAHKPYMDEWQSNNSSAPYSAIREDLILGNNGAWTFGPPLADDSANAVSLLYYGNHNQYLGDGYPNGTRTLSLNYYHKLLRHYMLKVRRNAVRVGATTDNSNFQPTAFVNTDGRAVVVIEAATSGSFSITGLPANTYGVWSSTSDGTSGTETNGSDVVLGGGGTLTASVAAASWITIYAKTAITPGVRIWMA